VTRECAAMLPQRAAEADTVDAEEHKGQFRPVPEPPRAAGYAPVEPVDAGAEPSPSTDAPEG
jgi:hypothetical protein